MILVLLLIPIGYIGIAAVFYFIAKTWKGKTLVVLIFVLIPVGDVIVGRIYFYYLCTKHAGQEIYKIVELGDEYYLKPGEPDTSKWIFDFGVFTTSNGAKVDKEEFRKRYHLDLPTYDRSFSKIFHITKVDSVIRDKKANETLSSATTFLYYGGWVANSSGLHVSPNYCAVDDKQDGKRLIHSSLLANTFTKPK